MKRSLKISKIDKFMDNVWHEYIKNSHLKKVNLYQLYYCNLKAIIIK